MTTSNFPTEENKELALRLAAGREQDLATALRLLLDAMDYTGGACRPNEMVGAVVPKVLLDRAKEALARP